MGKGHEMTDTFSHFTCGTSVIIKSANIREGGGVDRGILSSTAFLFCTLGGKRKKSGIFLLSQTNSHFESKVLHSAAD